MRNSPNHVFLLAPWPYDILRLLGKLRFPSSMTNFMKEVAKWLKNSFY